eukprot:TRINITY_DN64726_c0_g1_i1.p1 TRINITY_DN64726_c0_g1~~TRINITY_DN64726_c0_g1_i1.p1  ORF type:complete len:708 (-),score=87.79 TRINITY_DN64726_c0_g1_i1:256-2379(-)
MAAGEAARSELLCATTPLLDAGDLDERAVSRGQEASGSCRQLRKCSLMLTFVVIGPAFLVLFLGGFRRMHPLTARQSPVDSTMLLSSPGTATSTNALARSQSWYHICRERGPYCDMRMNIKEQVDLESKWAWDFLQTLDLHRIDLFMQFVQRLHHHIATVNKERGLHCPNAESLHDYLAYLRKRGFADARSGRAIANYVSSLHVAFKRASDAIHEAPALAEPPWNCAWRVGSPGWGDTRTQLEMRIKGKRQQSKFMWTQQKGRGTDLDKAAMTTGVRRDVVTDAMGKTFEALWKLNRGEKEMYQVMPAADQRLLPGRVRWAQTFRNAEFGLYAYGDEPKWTDATHDYFFQEIVHGMGIHGRNLTWGSPADRMLLLGMPWIGGVSGSHVDFYLAASNLGYTGKQLADLMLVDIACLVAGGQHSLGELLFAATEADIEDNGRPRFEKDGDATYTYFATPSYKRLVAMMNLPDAAWTAATFALVTSGSSLHELYNAALHEFFQRAGPAGFERQPDRQLLRTSLLPATRQNLLPCLGLPATMWLREAVYTAGGPKRAFSEWTLDGATPWLAGLSAVELIAHVGHEAMSKRIIYCEVAFKTMAAGKAVLTKKAFDAYTESSSGAKSMYLFSLVTALKPRLQANLWRESRTDQRDVTESEFSLAFVEALDGIVADLHTCLVDVAGHSSGEQSGSLEYDVFEGFYAMAWSDAST